MIMNSRSGKDFRAKQEGDHQDCDNYNKISKIIPSSSSRQQWSSTLKNPRIVRVSRNFGGKDRHSKVCTIRGLRDRRIRLSVPTAVQLYDLQDRLGLGQPSKVVDWLLEVTKHEIDKLPPLPMPFGMNFAQFAPQESSANQTHNYQAILSRKEELGIKNQENHQEGLGFGGYVAQNFFPMGSNYQSSFPMNYNWDHHSSNLSLSQFGSHSFANQIEETSSATPPSSNSQLYFYPSPTTMPPFNFPPLIPSVMSMMPSMENDLRQINHLQQVHQQNPIFPTTLHLISSNANQKNVRPMEQRNEESSDS